MSTWGGTEAGQVHCGSWNSRVPKDSGAQLTILRDALSSLFRMRYVRVLEQNPHPEEPRQRRLEGW
jgi:hypothetical protein